MARLRSSFHPTLAIPLLLIVSLLFTILSITTNSWAQSNQWTNHPAAAAASSGDQSSNTSTNNSNSNSTNPSSSSSAEGMTVSFMGRTHRSPFTTCNFTAFEFTQNTSNVLWDLNCWRDLKPGGICSSIGSAPIVTSSFCQQITTTGGLLWAGFTFVCAALLLSAGLFLAGMFKLFERKPADYQGLRGLAAVGLQGLIICAGVCLAAADLIGTNALVNQAVTGARNPAVEEDWTASTGVVFVTVAWIAAAVAALFAPVVWGMPRGVAWEVGHGEDLDLEQMAVTETGAGGLGLGLRGAGGGGGVESKRASYMSRGGSTIRLDTAVESRDDSAGGGGGSGTPDWKRASYLSSSRNDSRHDDAHRFSRASRSESRLDIASPDRDRGHSRNASYMSRSSTPGPATRMEEQRTVPWRGPEDPNTRRASYLAAQQVASLSEAGIPVDLASEVSHDDRRRSYMTMPKASRSENILDSFSGEGGSTNGDGVGRRDRRKRRESTGMLEIAGLGKGLGVEDDLKRVSYL